METIHTQPPWRILIRLFTLWTGVAILALCAIYFLSAWLSAPRWASVGGYVISAGIDTREVSRPRSVRQGGGTYRYTLYSPDISYRYIVDGQAYIGHGIGDGGDRNYESRAGAMAALAPYTRGPLTVYYDPADPERSALDPALFSRIVLIFGGVGLLLVAIGFYLRQIDATTEEAAPADEEESEGFAPQR